MTRAQTEGVDDQRRRASLSRPRPDRRRYSRARAQQQADGDQAELDPLDHGPGGGVVRTLKTLSGLAPSMTLTSCRPRVMAYADPTRTRSARPVSRPVGKARKMCRNSAAGTMSKRCPTLYTSGWLDHCSGTSPMMKPVSSISGPSRLAGRRHQATRPPTTYGMTIQPIRKTRSADGSSRALARLRMSTPVSTPMPATAMRPEQPGAGSRA